MMDVQKIADEIREDCTQVAEAAARRMAENVVKTALDSEHGMKFPREQLKVVKAVASTLLADGITFGYQLGRDSLLVQQELTRGLNQVMDKYDSADAVADVNMVVTDEDIEKFLVEETAAYMRSEKSVSEEECSWHTVMLARFALRKIQVYEGWSSKLARERVSQMIILRRIVAVMG